MVMNVARIHDKLSIMNFWERKIEKHNRVAESEEMRMKNSALPKLRDDWTVRLERQTKHMKEANEENHGNA